MRKHIFSMSYKFDQAILSDFNVMKIQVQSNENICR